jgi:hypothetical protein
MSHQARRQHWEQVYGTKGEEEVSWFEANPVLSLELDTRKNRVAEVGNAMVAG